MSRTSPLAIHAKAGAFQIDHVQVLPIKRLGATPAIRYQNHPSQMRHRVEDFVNAFHDPHSKPLISVLREDIHICQVIDRHHIRDPSGEANQPALA